MKETRLYVDWLDATSVDSEGMYNQTCHAYITSDVL